MMQEVNWEKFWQEWRNKDAENEDDLFFQVGLTINKKPMEKEAIDLINQSIEDHLKLNGADTLVELCCGNGLTTFVLKDKVKQVHATDFSAHLIKAAKEFKSAHNITYNFAAVTDFLEHFKEHTDDVPTKYLMNNSLAYFTPEELHKILSLIVRISGEHFLFLIRGIPNDLLKWNYYNTEERRKRYEECVATGDKTNDGLGRWWSPMEIQDLCNSLGLQFTHLESNLPMSEYRMDVLISK